MELRLAAHFSQDKTLCMVYKTGGDIHDATAKAVGCERRQAKVINFGILYGIGVKALAKNLNTTYDDARKYIKGYFDTYPGVRIFMHQTKRQAVTQGYVKLYGGRHRNIKRSFEKKTDWEKEGELRSLSNAVIQGSGAMIIKEAMVELGKQLSKFPQNSVKIIAQIHDELIIECDEILVSEVKNIVKDALLKPTLGLSVPFEVDVKIGKNWEEIH
jgi:DNA polymerase-1